MQYTTCPGCTMPIKPGEGHRQLKDPLRTARNDRREHHTSCAEREERKAAEAAKRVIIPVHGRDHRKPTYR